jgi:hypothetical protein
VLASLPHAWLRHDLRRLLLVCVFRSAVLAMLTLAIFLPLLWWFGPSDSLRFFSFHATRGIEIGSVYSYLALVLGVGGLTVAWESSHKSIEIHSVLSPVLAMLFPVIAATVLLGAYVWIARLLGRVATTDQQSVAQRYPSDFAGFATVLLLLFMATSKVFSPQYLLWIVPLLPLAPMGRFGSILGGAIAAVAMTSVIYPLYWDALQAPGALMRLALPLYTARNVIFGFVLWHLMGVLSQRFGPPKSLLRS